jgi:hypothetical protein
MTEKTKWSSQITRRRAFRRVRKKRILSPRRSGWQRKATIRDVVDSEQIADIVTQWPAPNGAVEKRNTAALRWRKNAQGIIGQDT